MQSQDLQKRVNDAGMRLVMVEIEVASSLLSSMDGLRDPRQRMQCLKEARATIELAWRLATLIQFPDCNEISRQIEELRDRVSRVSARRPESALLKMRVR